MTLVYDFDPQKPAGAKEEPRGGSLSSAVYRLGVPDYGKTESSPLSEPLYAFLEQAGYQRNVNIRVAGYDFRLTPDMGGFMERTTALIEETYRENRQHPCALWWPTQTGRSTRNIC